MGAQAFVPEDMLHNAGYGEEEDMDVLVSKVRTGASMLSGVSGQEGSVNGLREEGKG